MTSTRYLLCRLALAFGYARKNIRMGDAAGEMHLLKEAEAHLGEGVWKKVEKIEDLSVEYWNLRKLAKERDRVAVELDDCQRRLAAAHEERATLLGIATEHYQDLNDERKRILDSLEKLARERDRIVASAREIRRNYDGIKTKREVLEKEGDHATEALEQATTRLVKLKKNFTELKKQRTLVAEKITEGDASIDEIDARILLRKKERRVLASEAFQHIGDANQELSRLRAELGVLETQMRQLFSEIGRHVSRSAPSDSECASACKEYRGLVDVMRALRKSIQLNHRLAELS